MWWPLWGPPHPDVPGWHYDSSDPRLIQRYYDGKRWTSQVRPAFLTR